MSIFTEALNQSLALEEREILDESYWDLVAPLVMDGSLSDEEEPVLGESLTEEVKEEESKEEKSEEEKPSKKDPRELSISDAIDMYESLLEGNCSKEEARAKVISESNACREALKEDSQLTRSERLAREKQRRWNSYVEEFRKQNGFSLDEELNEEKLKYHTMQIKEHAIRHGIPSAKFKEALIKGIN